jgi:uncharacterized membrane protein
MSHHHHHEAPTRIGKPTRINTAILGFFFVILMLVLIAPSSVTKSLLISNQAAPTTGTESYQPDKFYLAKVNRIIAAGTQPGVEGEQKYQVLELLLLNGPQAGKIVQLQNDIVSSPEEMQIVKEGEEIVVTEIETAQGTEYYFSEKFRLPAVIVIAAAFFFLTFLLGGYKGITSILGLAFSLFVIVNVIVPRIIKGENPLLVSLVGSILIACVSLYLAHGFTKRTSVALASTLITIILATIIAILFVNAAQLFGVGSEEAIFLKVGRFPAISLQGLLLGGIIIGVLGVLDDVTTAQTATIDEISKANSELSFWQLYRSGLSVGHEHIASLVNTLVLAYTGSAMPLLLLFTTNESIPAWVTLNTEPVVEEIIRTLVGSSSLILAVPISTLLAAYFFSRRHGQTTHQLEHHH